MFARSRIFVLVASACLAAGFSSIAGAEQDPSAVPTPGGQVQQAAPDAGQQGDTIVVIPEQQAQSYSDADLHSVALALVAVDRIAHAYLPQLEAASTPEDEDKVREAAVGEATQAISDTGITVDKYNEILTVARNDPQVAERIKTQLQSLPNEQGSAGDGNAAAQGGAGDQSVPANPNTPAQGGAADQSVPANPDSVR